MRHGLRALICLGLVGGAACNQVWNAVTTEDCQPGSTNPECASTGWPTTGHGANSDPWLVTHNQVITQMTPWVLVLNFDNSATSDQTMKAAQALATAIAVGSSYHGYQNADAPPFLQYQIRPIVDLTNYNPNNPTSNPNNPVAPSTWTNPSSTLLPTDSTGQFDPSQLFQAQFADFGFSDMTVSPPRPLSLGELFENGLINEVWVQDGELDLPTGPQRRFPLYLERKQRYDQSGAAVTGSGSFDCVGGGTPPTVCLPDIPCNVTVRMSHLDPIGGAGAGCDLEIRGWGIEGMWDALPEFQPDAAAFLNQDFDSRFGVRFNSWPEICTVTDAENQMPCVSYPSPTSATGTYTDGTTWTIDPFLQGCGSSQFPPNAVWRGDFDDTTSNVQSRCEHFGLNDNPAGGDTYQMYPAAALAAQPQTYVGCGGDWQIYWRQSMPGYQNQATAHDGTPMKNWWPMLFY
jgi:hypothetical protein